MLPVWLARGAAGRVAAGWARGGAALRGYCDFTSTLKLVCRPKHLDAAVWRRPPEPQTSLQNTCV